MNFEVGIVAANVVISNPPTMPPIVSADSIIGNVLSLSRGENKSSINAEFII